MPTTIYSKPNCVQCLATTRSMDRQDIPYTLIDLTKDGDAFLRVQELGYKQAPVVVTSDGTHWSGFNPVEIAKLIPIKHEENKI